MSRTVLGGMRTDCRDKNVPHTKTILHIVNYFEVSRIFCTWWKLFFYDFSENRKSRRWPISFVSKYRFRHIYVRRREEVSFLDFLWRVSAAYTKWRALVLNGGATETNLIWLERAWLWGHVTLLGKTYALLVCIETKLMLCLQNIWSAVVCVVHPVYVHSNCILINYCSEIFVEPI